MTNFEQIINDIMKQLNAIEYATGNLRFKKIRDNIIKKLNSIEYKRGDLTDIGNEVGIAIGIYTTYKNAERLGLTKADFISGLEHGISIIDGTHDE